MDCQDARAQLVLLVRGGLGLTELAILDLHLKHCVACSWELDRLRSAHHPGGPVVQGLVLTTPLRLATEAASGVIAVTRLAKGRLPGLLARARFSMNAVGGASARLANDVREVLGNRFSRLIARAVTHVTWRRARMGLTSAAGIALMSALVLYVVGQLTAPPTPATGRPGAPSPRPPIAPFRAAVSAAPPTLIEPSTPADELVAVGPPVARPDATVASAAPTVPERLPARVSPRPAGPKGSSASRSLADGPGPPVPAPEAPEVADVLGVPDVIGRLAVTNIRAAERDLTALLERLGGTDVARQRGHTSTALHAVVPRSGYAELSRGLAAMGVWLVEAQRSSLPDGIRITIRLSPSGPSRSRAASVGQLG